MNRLAIFIVLVSVSAKLTGQNVNKEQLVGIWQVHQHIADGFSDNYQIFENGTFKFNYSQMNCTKRVIYLKGEWTLKNDTLILFVKEKMIVEGGTIVKDPICDSLVKDGIYKKLELTDPEIMKLKVTIQPKALLNDFGPEIDHIRLDCKDFYRIKEDPYDYF